MGVSCHIHQHYRVSVMSQLAAGLKVSGSRQHLSRFLLQLLSCTETKERVYV